MPRAMSTSGLPNGLPKLMRLFDEYLLDDSSNIINKRPMAQTKAMIPPIMVFGIKYIPKTIIKEISINQSRYAKIFLIVANIEICL